METVKLSDYRGKKNVFLAIYVLLYRRLNKQLQRSSLG